MITIKKYRNRRLYDTETSRYVKLEDVAEMVRTGTELEVVDVNSGEDITRQVLTQIIVEGSRDNDQGLPIEFLRQMITATGRGRHELMSKYSNFVAGIYQRAQEELRDRFQQDGTGEGTPIVNPLDWFQRYVQPGRQDTSTSNAGAPDATPSPEPATPPEQPDDPVAELNALRAKLEAIEKSLVSSTAKVPNEANDEEE